MRNLCMVFPLCEQAINFKHIPHRMLQRLCHISIHSDSHPVMLSGHQISVDIHHIKSAT